MQSHDSHNIVVCITWSETNWLYICASWKVKLKCSVPRTSQRAYLESRGYKYYVFSVEWKRMCSASARRTERVYLKIWLVSGGWQELRQCRWQETLTLNPDGPLSFSNNKNNTATALKQKQVFLKALLFIQTFLLHLMRKRAVNKGSSEGHQVFDLITVRSSLEFQENQETFRLSSLEMFYGEEICMWRIWIAGGVVNANSFTQKCHYTLCERKRSVNKGRAPGRPSSTRPWPWTAMMVHSCSHY